MLSVKTGIQQLIDNLLEIKGACPSCQEPLYAWKAKNKDGSDRCAPTCMRCGYHDLKRKEDHTTKRLFDESLKNRALNFFKNGSIVPNEKLFEKRLSNFREVDPETKNAMVVAKRFVNEVLLGESPHLVLNGKTGAGKSHLAMGVCWEVLERSNYDKKVAIINYRELLEQIRFSFADEEARKVLQGNLIKDLKTIDLVVIDDLGAELGQGTERQATAHNNDVLLSLLEAREDKALVITTNLSSKEIKSAYGDRVLSRIKNNALSHTFIETADKRGVAN